MFLKKIEKKEYKGDKLVFVIRKCLKRETGCFFFGSIYFKTLKKIFPLNFHLTTF